MSTPINEIFNERAIAEQTKRVLDQLQSVAAAMKEIKVAVDSTKISAADAAGAKRAAAIEAATQKAAAATAKRAAEEEKLAAAVAKRAAAELQLAKANGTAVSSLSEMDRLTRLYEEGMKKLNGTLTTEAEKLAQVRVANAEVSKQLKQQAREVLGLSGAYDKLQQEYQQAKVAAQNLGAQLGVTSNEYKAAAASAIALNNQLKAIDGGIGNFQRNVGNYASGFVNVNQVLREVPNFAISATVGMQALSNNLPMMVDEIKSFVKEGNGFKDVMAMIGKSVFSLGGGVILLTTLITALPGILREMGAEAKKADDELRSFFEGVTREQTDLKILFEVAKDVNQEMGVRKNAIKELRDQYGNYLQNMSDEEILAGNTASVYNQLAEAILKSAKARAASDQITKLQAANLMDEEKSLKLAAKAEKEAADARLEIARRSKLSLREREFLAPVASPTMILDAAGIEKSQISKDIMERNAQMERLMKTVMENQVKPFKLDSGAGGGKNAAKEYYDEINRLEVLRLEQQNLYFAAIRDDDAYTYEVRLEAARRFAVNEQKILDAQFADDISRNEFELKNKKDAKDKEKEIYANFRIQQSKAEIAYIDIVAGMQNKARQDRLAKEKQTAEDIEKAKEAVTKSAEDKLADATLRQDEMMYKELRDLNFAFINGEIQDHEDYEKKKTAITQKYAIKRIEAEIKATEALLAVAELGSKDQQKYATQLAELKNKLVEIGVNSVVKGNKKEEESDTKRKRSLESDLRDINRAVNTITSAINELGAARFERLQAALDVERAGIEKNASLELERIRNSSLSEQQKADQTIILEARKQAQIEENDRKRRKLEQERARFERLNSIASIISGTALAVVNALGDKATPGPLRIVLAAAIGALGAAQLARAIATPIPKYKMGTQHHKGGLAIVGDGGKSERVILPSGEQFDTPNKSTLVNLPKGAKVLPDAALADRLMKNNMPRRVQVKSDTKDEALMIWQTRELAKAFAKNKPKVSTKVNVNLGRDIWLHKNVFE